MQSAYFGGRGTAQSTLDKNPLHQELLKIVPREQNKIPVLGFYIMKIALQVFCTNFENMRNNKKKLSNLLKALLQIYLAPKREVEIQKYKSEKQLQYQPSSKKTIFLNSVLFDRISTVLPLSVYRFFENIAHFFELFNTMISQILKSVLNRYFSLLLRN